MKFDRLFYNGKIYTMEQEGECFSAMGIRKGKIAGLFSRDPGGLSSLSRELINLEKRTVLPGLIDSHAHFMATAGMKALGIPMYEIREGELFPGDLEGIHQRARELSRTVPPGKPLLCNNYVISAIKEDRLPSKEEIDTWFPGRVVIFLSIDGHASSYSTPGLEAMGVNPEGHRGILTGEAHEKRIKGLNTIILKALDFKTILKGIENTVNEALSQGITTIHCLEGFDDSPREAALGLFKWIAPLLPLNLRLYPQIRKVKEAAAFFPHMLSPRIGGCGPWEIDGAVGARTAAFYGEYNNSPGNRGELFNNDEELTAIVTDAVKAGCQVTSHVIGTRGIDQLLKIYAPLLKGENPLRLRVDHFEFPGAEAVDLALEHKLLMVPQPGFFWMDETVKGMGTYRKYLSPEVIAQSLPLRTIFRKGGIICGSSDSPVQPLNPFLQIHGMVNYPLASESLSVYEAFRTYTCNGALATFEEEIRGTLKKGKAADFIILEQDPFTINPGELINLKVSSTWIGGREIKPGALTLARLAGERIFRGKKKL